MKRSAEFFFIADPISFIARERVPTIPFIVNPRFFIARKSQADSDITRTAENDF